MSIMSITFSHDDARLWADAVGAMNLPDPVKTHPRRYGFESLRDELGPMSITEREEDIFGHLHVAEIEWLPTAWSDGGMIPDEMVWDPSDPPAHLAVSDGGHATVRTHPMELSGIHAQIFEASEIPIDVDLTDPETFHVIHLD